MELTLIHLYPDLMNLYGSYANLSVLRRTLEGLGHSVTVKPVLPGEAVELDGCHFLYLGAGTERAQKAALQALTPDGEAIRQAAEASRTRLSAISAPASRRTAPHPRPCRWQKVRAARRTLRLTMVTPTIWKKPLRAHWA